jgi:hypothetical protein
MRAIAACAQVEAPVEDVYALLADLREHWRLAGRWVEPLELGPDGGIVRLRGPLGLTRTARTRVVHTEAPTRLAGEAEVGHTRASVSWRLWADGDSTWVTLQAEVLTAGAVDRALLALGGGRWLGARFRTTLARLAQHATKSLHEPSPVPVG